MKITVLSSGSDGNCSLIMTDQHKVLLDAGLSGKKIEDLLAQVHVDIKDIDLAFLSHDHSDHSKGLGVLMRRYPKIQVYANRGSWDFLIRKRKIGKVPVEQMNFIEPGQTLEIDDLTITAFATSHDAACPQYYVFENKGKRFACLTDTGYVSSKMEQAIRGADAYLMEFNYDPMMLRNGPYSWSLKDRILSDHGHLSNEDAANALLDVVSEKTKYIFLAHRSQHNNTKKLAHKTAVEMLVEGESALPPDVQILDTDPEKPTKIIKL